VNSREADHVLDEVERALWRTIEERGCTHPAMEESFEDLCHTDAGQLAGFRVMVRSIAMRAVRRKTNPHSGNITGLLAILAACVIACGGGADPAPCGYCAPPGLAQCQPDHLGTHRVVCLDVWRECDGTQECDDCVPKGGCPGD
jgi:hypothetical protein